MKYKGIAVSGFSKTKFHYDFDEKTMKCYHRTIIRKWVCGCLAVVFAIVCIFLLAMIASEALQNIGLCGAFSALVIAGALCYYTSSIDAEMVLKLALVKTPEYKDFLERLHDMFEKHIQDNVETYNQTQGAYQQILLRDGIASLKIEEDIQQILKTIKEFRDEQNDIRKMIEKCDKINSPQKWERNYVAMTISEGVRWYVSFNVSEEK